MLKIAFYVPPSHLDAVKQAVFDAGGGRIGNYEHCCWQSLGQGQFKPMAGAQPFIGKSMALETLDEYRVEFVCEEALAARVLAEMKRAHPYETPAYDVVQLLDM